MSLRVLLLQPDTDDRPMYRHFLQTQGFQVQEAGTTDDALSLIPEAHAIITGLLVDGSIDPVALIEAIRKDSVTSRKPVIVVTACVVKEKLQQATSAGADAILLKPCLPEAVLTELRRVLKRRGVRFLGDDVYLVPIPDRRQRRDRRSLPRGGRRHVDWIGGVGKILVASAMPFDSWSTPTWTGHLIALERHRHRLAEHEEQGAMSARGR